MSYGNDRRLSPAEKAQRTRQSRVDWALYEALKNLPDDATEADVVGVFADFKATKTQKGNAFAELDERPGRFSGISYSSWHSRLRRTRNHPVHGRELFALFR